MPKPVNELPGQLRDKTALVLGASRGIGAAVARAFARAGAVLVLAARDRPALEVLAQELGEAGTRTLVVPTDVTDAGSVERLVEEIMSTYGRLDIACNNAAASHPRPTPLTDLSVADFDATLAVNLRGVFLAMKYEIPAMLSSGGGAIVNMSSTGGTQAVAGLAPYISSKHGLEGLTKVAALDYAKQDVRINAIAPGPILTEALERAGERAQQAAAAAMPMGRIGSPDEVASAAVWLCSEAASFVTGSTLVLDGGKLAGTPPFEQPRSS